MRLPSHPGLHVHLLEETQKIVDPSKQLHHHLNSNTPHLNARGTSTLHNHLLKFQSKAAWHFTTSVKVTHVSIFDFHAGAKFACPNPGKFDTRRL